MNKKQIISLIAILGLLIVAVVIKKVSPQKDVYEEEAESLNIEIDIPTFDGIFIQQGGADETVDLVREEEIWRIRSLWNARADSQKIERVFEELSNLKGEIRGQSEAIFPDFGIADDEALHIEVFEGEYSRLHLLIGTENPDWQNLFVRRADSEKVYFANSGLLSAIGHFNLKTDKLEGSKWADLKMFTMELADVTMVSVKDKGDESWINAWENLPFESEQSKITQYLNELENLRGSTVVDPEGEGYGLDDPAWQMKLLMDGGDEFLMSVGVTTDEEPKLYVSFENNPEVFTASQYVLDRVKADGSRFVRDDPFGMEADEPKSIMIETPEKQISLSLDEEPLPEGVTAYIDSLKTFKLSRVHRLSSEPTPLTFRLNITYAQKEAVSISCEDASGTTTDEVRCQKQSGIPFTIKRPTFEATFQNLDGLEKPVSESVDVQPETESTQE